MPAFLFQLFSSGPHGGGPVLSWRQKMNTGTQNAAQQNVARILLILGQRRVHAPQEQFAGDAKMRGGTSPVLSNTSAPSAIALASTNSSLRTLFPPAPRGVRSSRLTHRRGQELPIVSRRWSMAMNGVGHTPNGMRGACAIRCLICSIIVTSLNKILSRTDTFGGKQNFFPIVAADLRSSCISGRSAREIRRHTDCRRKLPLATVFPSTDETCYALKHKAFQTIFIKKINRIPD